MHFQTTGQSERIPLQKLLVPSILRIVSEMQKHRDKALVGASPEVVLAYNDVILKGEVVRQKDAARPQDSTKILPLDRNMDRIFSGIRLITEGLQKIFDPEDAVALTVAEKSLVKTLQTFITKVFPDGFWFLRLPWREQWAENERTLTRLAQPETPKQVGPVDFTPIQDRATRVQQAFGDALGITGDPKAEPLFAALADWEAALEWLDGTVFFKHRGDLELRDRIFAPYFAELKWLEQERQRRLQEAREEKKKKEEEAKKQAAQKQETKEEPQNNEPSEEPTSES